MAVAVSSCGHRTVGEAERRQLKFDTQEGQGVDAAVLPKSRQVELENNVNLSRYAAGAFAATLVLAAPVHAQEADPVSALRRDMDALRQEYQSRIGELEQRLAAAEADAAAAHAAADAAQAAVQAAPADASPDMTAQLPDQSAPLPSTPATSNANIYNPGIAVALNAGFSASSNPTGAEVIAGFASGDDIGRPERGFSLGESEVSFTANIDPFLAGFFDFSIDNSNDISLEEAYIRTTALPGGLTLKAGRFLSGIAYLNERHAHDWSFSDAPLPYRAFLNTQLGDDGVQLRWIAPTNQYLEFGVEAFRGDSFPAAGAENNGVGSYAAFVRTGSDINVSSSYLAALSYLHTDAVDRESGTDRFTGDTDVGVATLVYKWAPGGNPLLRNLTLVGEYFYGTDDGRFNGLPLNQSHSGWYVQGVYQFEPRWSAGLRVSGLDSDDPGAAFAGTQLDDLGHTPMDYTALLEFDTSEFGRLRLQYARDDAGLEPNDVISFAYTVIYGPHGAHRY